MSLFSRLFGARNPLDEIRKAARQDRWADVLSFSSALDESLLADNNRLELNSLVENASEKLAKINYEEGIAILRTDDIRRGVEHLDLARQLVRSAELRELIEAEFTRIGQNNHELSGDNSPAKESRFKTSCASSCCGSSHAGTDNHHATPYEFDDDTRYELILTAYPLDIRERYQQLSPLLRQAVLLAHEEEAEKALSLFLQVVAGEHNDIYYYEVGTLYARLNRYAEAVNALQQAIKLNPGYLLAAVALVDLHVIHKNYPPATDLLGRMLAANYVPDYCHARYSTIFESQGNYEKAFEHASEALRFGNKDPELMTFVARVLESRGRYDDAEAVLAAIPTSGGCSGGANVALADFWVRHKKNLQKSLEMFKNAAKSDPTNPLWGYHIARVYLALGWKKDANQILDKMISSESVDPALRDNAIKLLRSAA